MSRHMFTWGKLRLRFRKTIKAAITYHLAKDTAPINTVQHEGLKDALSSWRLLFFFFWKNHFSSNDRPWTKNNIATYYYASAILQCFFTHRCNKHFVKKSCQRIVISIQSKNIVIHIFSRIVWTICGGVPQNQQISPYIVLRVFFCYAAYSFGCVFAAYFFALPPSLCHSCVSLSHTQTYTHTHIYTHTHAHTHTHTAPSLRAHRNCLLENEIIPGRKSGNLVGSGRLVSHEHLYTITH